MRLSHRHHLAIPLASTASSNAFITIVSALGGVIVARSLGPAGRGEYAIVLVSFAIVQVIAEGGVQGATTFFAAKLDTNRRSLIRSCGHLLVGQGAVAAVLAIGVLWLPPVDVADRAAFVIILVGLVPILWLSARLFALQGFDIAKWNAARLSQALVYLGSLAATAWSGVLTVNWAALIFSLSNLAGGFVALGLARPRTCASGTIVVSRPEIRAYSWPNFAWTVPVTLSARVDQVAVALFATSATLGVYAVSLSLMSLTTPVVAAIGNVTMPSLSRMSSQGQATSSRALQMAALGAGVAVTASCGIALLSIWVVPWLFGSSFDDAVQICWLLVPGVSMYGIKWVAADSLRGMGLPGVAARCEWIGLVFVVALTIPATAAFGSTGAALAPTLGYGVATALMLVAMNRSGVAPTGGLRAST